MGGEGRLHRPGRTRSQALCILTGQLNYHTITRHHTGTSSQFDCMTKIDQQMHIHMTGRDHVACVACYKHGIFMLLYVPTLLHCLFLAQCELCHLHRPSLSLTCMCLVDTSIYYFLLIVAYHQLLCQRSGWAVSLLLAFSSSVCSCLVGCVLVTGYVLPCLPLAGLTSVPRSKRVHHVPQGHH